MNESSTNFYLPAYHPVCILIFSKFQGWSRVTRNSIEPAVRWHYLNDGYWPIVADSEPRISGVFCVRERQLFADSGPSYSDTSHKLNVYRLKSAERQKSTLLCHSNADTGMSGFEA